MRAVITLLLIWSSALLSSEDNKFDYIQAVVESNYQIEQLLVRAKNNIAFVDGENYYNKAIVTKDAKNFINLMQKARDSYEAAAKEGVLLGAFYAQHISEAYFFTNPSHITSSLTNGSMLSRAGFCIGYIYLAGAYERTKNWIQAKQIAEQGLKQCNKDLLPNWMIDRLRVLKSSSDFHLSSVK